MEILDANHSSVEVRIQSQKASQRLWCDIPAAGDRDVRMPRAQLRLDPRRERGFLHAFVDLKQMRVRSADTDPDNFRSTFCRKHPDTSNGQKERAELDHAKFFTQREINGLRHITEERERQVHLRRISPAHAADVRVKISKQPAGCVRQIDRNEKTVGHIGQSSARPAFAMLRRGRHRMSNVQLSARERLPLWRVASFFVVLLSRTIGKPCYPSRCSPRQLRPAARFIALLTPSSGKKPIYKFHQVAGQIWKKSIAQNNLARSKGERKRWLPATAGSENFPRGAIGVHRNERRTRGSSEPGKLVIMPAFEFRIHMRTGTH